MSSPSWHAVRTRDQASLEGLGGFRKSSEMVSGLEPGRTCRPNPERIGDHAIQSHGFR